MITSCPEPNAERQEFPEWRGRNAFVVTFLLRPRFELGGAEHAPGGIASALPDRRRSTRPRIHLVLALVVPPAHRAVYLSLISGSQQERKRELERQGERADEWPCCRAL